MKEPDIEICTCGLAVFRNDPNTVQYKGMLLHRSCFGSIQYNAQARHEDYKIFYRGPNHSLGLTYSSIRG